MSRVDLVFPGSIDQTDTLPTSKWSIAEGAARCHATAMDVDDFFDLGAAIGLQTRTTTANDGELASEMGEILFFKVGLLSSSLVLPPELSSAPKSCKWCIKSLFGRTDCDLKENGGERHCKVDIEVDGSKRKFRIIANPFHVDPKARLTSNVVLVKDSYDVWDLVLEYLPSSGGDPIPIPNGRHLLEVAELVCKGREAILVLRLRPNFSWSARRSERILKKLAIGGVNDWSLLFDVPLTSCGPSNLVELDLDRIRGRFWKLEGDTDGSPFAVGPARS